MKLNSLYNIYCRARNAFLVVMLFAPVCFGQSICILSNKSHENFDITISSIEKNIKNSKPGIEVYIIDPVASKLPNDVSVLIPLGTTMTNWAKLNRPDLPIVFGLVLNPEQSGLLTKTSKEIHMTGVSLDIPVKSKIERIKSVLPSLQKIGMLVSTERNSAVSKNTQEELRQLGYEVVEVITDSPQDVPDKLQGISGKVDLLWMIPDANVYNIQTVRYLIPFCIKTRLPVMALSRSYTEAGALLAVSWDFDELGKQISELAIKVIQGENPDNIPVEAPDSSLLLLNKRTADRIGITSITTSNGLEIVQR